MCTVTFVRSGGKTIITSNRDEHIARSAIEPRTYDYGAKQLTFPKDPKAGGTWFAADQNGSVAVLLNGASEKHSHRPPYLRSRGLIVLDLMGSTSPYTHWGDIVLDNIEPFTLVLYENRNLYQLRWNGQEKETIKLDPQQNHIWSSTTLYPQDVRERRASWFADFMAGNESPDDSRMFHFHRYTEEGNTENGLVIDRMGFLKTVSITQAVIGETDVLLNHHDLVNNTEFHNTIFVV